VQNTHIQNCYHPLFIVLFIHQLLPPEHIKKIPRTTRQNWNKYDYQKAYGYEHCTIYQKHLKDIKRAHKYAFTKYVMSIATDILNTIVAITDNTLFYKKILRTQKNKIVEHISNLALKGFPLKRACKLFGIKTSWYQYHKRKINCPLSNLRYCFKQHPNQLTYIEQNNIKKWMELTQNKTKNLTGLYYEALNNAIIFCSKTTFNLYAYLNGYKKIFRKPKAKKKKGFRASAIFEYLHIDVSYIPTLFDGVQKIALVKDNFSKAPLHYIRMAANTNVDSTVIATLLQQTFDKYKLFDRTHNINIVSDGGSENKGSVLSWIASIKAPPCVQKITAKSDVFPYSNSMIEGSFHLFKHDFLNGETITTALQCDKKINEFINHCLHRYFGELYGTTPAQILDGAIPDKHKFKKQIEQAKKDRIIANKLFNGCTMSSCA
jgi:hypothetical protein